MTRRVVLIRHGRSSHVHTGSVDRAGFLRWREAYEAAGIDDVPPDALRDLIAKSDLIAASDSRRAIESAKALAPDREVVTSDLLRELGHVPPQLRGIRLPMSGWLVLFLLRWMVTDDIQSRSASARISRRGGLKSEPEKARRSSRTGRFAAFSRAH